MPTNTFDLIPTDWTDLGPTPCAVQAIDGEPLTFVIDTTVPASVDTVGHVVGAHTGNAWADIGFDGQHVFARALFEPTRAAVSR